MRRFLTLAGALFAGLVGASWWMLHPAAAAAPPPAAVTFLEHPAPPGARLPRLARRPGGGFVFSWIETTAAGHALKVAENVNDAWSAPVEVARGADWFVNWIDFASVVPIDRDFWVAHWLVRRPDAGPMDYDISLAISTDGGRRWRGPLRPYRSDTQAQYGFVSIFADAGAAGIVWLDGRDYVLPAEKSRYPQRSGNFALRHARVHRDGRIEPDVVIDPNVCSCCQTSAAMTDDGPVVAYRGRTDAEVRDNHLALWRGSAWVRGAALGSEGWVIAGCPTDGPVISAHGNQVVAVWSSGAGGAPRVRAAFSDDGGRTIKGVVDVDNRDPVGRLGLVRLDDRTAVVAWIGAADARIADAPLLVRSLVRDGEPGPVRQIGRIPTSRDSGVPQVVVDGERLVLAWTLPRPQYGIRLAVAAARDVPPVVSATAHRW